ncbi:hypothetical protein ECB94_20640 [Vibrio mediterranei]|uniref:Uncharacterized protein n=1 Tax=Vibrio mediterranei TaxID=689 RepID=A0A3G4VFY5_9VIBR|nr:hypothetical protein ECB94_20640 [Vibrio mediterranei]
MAIGKDPRNYIIGALNERGDLASPCQNCALFGSIEHLKPCTELRQPMRAERSRFLGHNHQKIAFEFGALTEKHHYFIQFIVQLFTLPIMNPL